MAKKVTLKRFVERLNRRVESGEISKTKALHILRGKKVSLKRRKKLLKREEKILKTLSQKLMKKRR